MVTNYVLRITLYNILYLHQSSKFKYCSNCCLIEVLSNDLNQHGTLVNKALEITLNAVNGSSVTPY